MKRSRTRTELAASVVGVAVLVAGWELAGRVGALGRTFPSLSAIAGSVDDNWGLLVRATVNTASRAVGGYLVGVLIAAAGATVAVLLPRIERLVLRSAVIVKAIPVIALGPIIVVVGSRETTPFLFAIIAVVFTTMTAIIAGVRSVDPDAAALFRVFAPSRATTLVRLELPSAVPLIIDGLRVAAPAAFLGAILGEWFGAESGLGILMLNAMRNLQTGMLWSSALLALACSALAYGSLGIADALARERFGRGVAFGSTALDDEPASPGSSRYLDLLGHVAPFGVLLIAWQTWVAVADVPGFVVPGPVAALSYIVRNWDEYVLGVAATLGSATAGLLLGFLAGAALALAASFSRMLRSAIAPVTLVIPSIPVIIFIPIVARIVGFNALSIIASVGLMVFFPVFVLLDAGMRGRPAGADHLFGTYGVSRARRLVLLDLPAAIGNAFAALRVVTVTTFLGTLTAEWLMGTTGLGRIFSEGRVHFELERAWGAIVISIALSVYAYIGASRLERVGRDRWA